MRERRKETKDTLAGSLLLAHPSMRDPNFRRSVVLMSVHNAEGAMGVVLVAKLTGAPVSATQAAKASSPATHTYFASGENPTKVGAKRVAISRWASSYFEFDVSTRAMAAWKRKGGLGPFHERLVGRMVEKGYERDYAENIFKQIQGFGEYGFPESHAASFAKLVWVSAWLKHHHPGAFACALLNSQPMGFYAPAQIVRDAREHGVEVRPVDVSQSDWDCGLEPADGGLALQIGRAHV